MTDEDILADFISRIAKLREIAEATKGKPNELLRIEHLWAIVSEDETGEGLCAAPLLGPGTMMPLIAADEARLASIMEWGRKVAKQFVPKKVKVVKFTTREELMVIEPE